MEYKKLIILILIYFGTLVTCEEKTLKSYMEMTKKIQKSADFLSVILFIDSS